MTKNINQSDLIFSYYKKHPKKPIPHAEVVDWATAAYEERTGKKLRDPDRAIRKLYQNGKLIMVKKGVYEYDPDAVSERTLEDFTSKQKEEIMKRGGYVCAVCGKGKKDGVELQVDHIKPKDKGGRATLENGQVLCGQHNYRKKNYDQTESGKRIFINLLKLAKKEGDLEMQDFCRGILRVYDEFDVNGHIEWDDADK